MIKPIPAHNPDKLDDAVLAMLSLCILHDDTQSNDRIQADPEFDYPSLKRLYLKGYLAACPSLPYHSLWLSPEGARCARELFQKLFCD